MKQKSQIKFVERIAVFLCLLAVLNFCKDNQDPVEDNAIVPAGTVDRSQVMTSSVLGKEMHYTVYLPHDYNTSSVSYPVLYLLHGMWGDYEDWADNGMANIMDYKIWKEEARPMIVIMPDGQDSFYCNNYNNGTILYEDFFIQEFMPYVEDKYRIIKNRNNRAIAGLSMGGYGATFLAFKHNQIFGSSYSMSGALSMGTAAPDIKAVIEAKTPEELSQLPAYTLECGTEDFLLTANNEFDEFLTGKGVTHTYVTRSGAHTWSFWITCLPKTLIFVSQYFD